MKKGKQIDIKLNLSNRGLYIFITLGILIVAGIGVYAASYTNSGAGHPYTEITTCAEGQFLKVINGVWTCAVYPTTNQNNCQWVEQDPPWWNSWSGEDSGSFDCPSGKVMVGLQARTQIQRNYRGECIGESDYIYEVLCC
jgi:hypothetical protein